MEHNYRAENKIVLIRPLAEMDIELLRSWRNDKNISRYLSDIPYITPEMQKDWYARYKKDEDTMLFSVVDKALDRVVGSVALCDFRDDNSCEVCRIVDGDPTAHGKHIAENAVALAVMVAKEYMGINRVRLFVHEDNGTARHVYTKSGFVETGYRLFPAGGIEISMEIETKNILSSDYINGKNVKGEIAMNKGQMCGGIDNLNPILKKHIDIISMPIFSIQWREAA